jgi:hypothetical protein
MGAMALGENLFSRLYYGKVLRRKIRIPAYGRLKAFS